MSDVFISYKAEDRKRIQPLVQALQGDGLSVWWDEHIGAGDAWRETIERQLGEAKCVIVVWSKRSVGPQGKFVREEASRAQRRGVYVPVLIDAVEPPLGFGESQATSLQRWHGDTGDAHYQTVLAAVRRNVGGESSAQPNRRSHVDRRAVIASGAAATVALAGTGAWLLLWPTSAGVASDSIAVLPFENLSGDPGQAYFSDGIAEELRSALARIAGLKVVGRTSSEAVRSDDTPIAAKKLGVANILTGSVRRSDTMMRISAQLVNGGNGLERWSQDYDRSPGDALKIESDIAENVARALAITLGRASQRAITAGGTQNAAAHDLYLKGRDVAGSDETEDGMRRATGLFDSAIALDPKFADAYAQKAIALVRLTGYYGTSEAFTTGSAQAAAIARQAIAQAPDLVSGHAALALVLSQQLNMSAALPEYRKAYALAPGDVDNLLLYSRFVSFLGNQQMALDLARQAERQDPLNAAVYSIEGSILRSSRRYDEGAAAYRKALQIAPKRLVSRALLSISLFGAGRIDEALAETEKLPSDYQFRLVNEAGVFCRQGNLAASAAAMSRADQLYGDSLSFQYAGVYAQCGDVDRAIASLEKAWSIRDPGLASIKAEPLLDPVRSDPRFADLLRKMNFPL